MKMMKKLLCCLMCLALLMSSMPAALAEETTLQVIFQGLWARGDGSWTGQGLTGRFSVMQDGAEIGVLENTGAGWNTLTLVNPGNVTLVPDMDAMPSGYMINAQGYSVSVAEGKSNAAPVIVYANAGLFTVQASANQAFELLGAQGAHVMTFAADEQGFYCPEMAIAAGVYVLRSEGWEDKVFQLPVYMGMPAQIVALTADFVSNAVANIAPAATEIPTAEPTAIPTEVPTAEPTAEPTPVPTAEPTEVPTAVPTEATTEAPTAEPTEEPTAVPTEAPTAEPTAEPTPVPTAKPTEVSTEIPTEEPTAAPNAEPTATPTEVPTEEPTAAPTEAPTAEPTPEPTAEPTATPEPVPVGSLSIESEGTGSAAYQLSLRGAEIAQGELIPGSEVYLTGVPEGEYLLTVSLPEDVMLAGFNGYPVDMLGQAQWQIVVEPDTDNLYGVEMEKLSSLTASFQELEGQTVTLTGLNHSASAVISGGQASLTGLRADVYTVTVPVAEDSFTGEGWTVSGGTAVANITIQPGEAAVLPELAYIIRADVSGRVARADGSGVEGAQITVLDGAGNAVAQTASDSSGAWIVTGLPEGGYTIRTDAGSGLAAADLAVTIEGEAGVSGLTVTAAKPASIHARSFIDKNNNGTRGTYEKFLPGIEVTAMLVSGGELIPVATAVTGDDGYAKLENIPAGEYVLRAKMPEGYGFGAQGKELRATHSVFVQSDNQVHDSVAFTVGEGDSVSAGVGALTLCTVTGTVWQDTNADGVWQEEEPRQAGVIVTMTGEKNGMVYETVSGEDGVFTISRARHGSYDLTFTLPEGKMFTRYSKTGGSRRSIITAEGTNVATDAIVLKTGDVLENRNIGVMEGATITGLCFKDANYNGYYDEGEDVLPGVELELMRQSTGKKITSTVSGEDGTFAFRGLRGSTFKIEALLPEGAAYTRVVDDPAGNQFAARPGRRQQTLSNIVLEDFGTYHLVVGAVFQGTVSGVAYLDDNFSGTMDEGEKIVTGLGVVLQDESGSKVAEGRTNGRGRYTFENINPGSYRLVLDAKRGYAFTKLGEGNVILNTGDGSGASEVFAVELGTNLQTMDLGMILPGTVEGLVFADSNDNGLRDGSEGGLLGTTVRLMDENGEQFSAVIGADGAFRFDAVMPGRYYLRYELPADGVFAEINAQGNHILGEGNVGAGEWFDFAVGSHVTAPVCGGLTLGSVTGTAFADHNGNGLMDAGEEALSGVTVSLTPAREGLTAQTVTTGDDGSFALTGLRPDTWQLSVTYPEGYVSSRTTGTTLPLTHGLNSQTVALSVPMGEMWIQQSLGGVIPAELTGYLWLDENNDGLWSDGEATPAGEKVMILDQSTGEVYDTMTTDENGEFETLGLTPGLYTLAYSLSAKNALPKAGDTTFTAEDGMLVMRDVQVSEGDKAGGMMLGVVRLTELGGQVWVDMGSQVKALSGANVTLSGSGVEQSVTTGGDGRYSFAGLLPGQYLISVTVPEGQVVVEPGDVRLTEGGMVSIMEDCSGLSARSGDVTVAMGQDQPGLDIGSVLPGRIGDRVWLDLNENGLQDDGEEGFPGVTIDLVREGEVVASTVSDQYGYYAFNGVYPATYTLRAQWPAEVEPTQQREDMPFIVSVLTESGESSPVTVGSDQRNYNADLGFKLVQPGKYPAGYGEGATQDWTRIGW